jgi:hypothetical protein
MCPLRGMNWGFISQKTTFFIVTAVKTSNLTKSVTFSSRNRDMLQNLKNASYM